jgi:UrcA family protein
MRFWSDDPNHFNSRRRIMNSTSEARNFARFAGVVLLGSAFLIGKVLASEPDAAPPSAVVKFGDLNLNSDAGIAALYKRIHRAAQGVCALPDDGMNLEVRAQELKCQSEAESRAVGSIHNAALSAYYGRRTGTRTAIVAMNGAH